MPELGWKVLLALGSGLLLNASPCVLPVLPLKVAVLRDELGEGRSARLRAGAAFLAGALVPFAVVGAAISLFGHVWGGFFQSTPYRTAVAGTLFLSGVAALRDRSLPPPPWFPRVPGRRLARAAFAGATVGLLATPCAGPLLASVLAYASTQEPGVVLLLFLTLGTGAALPVLALLAWPRALPTAVFRGTWAASMPGLLGWVLLGGSWFYSRSVLPGAPTTLVGWIVLLASAGWMIRAVLIAPNRAGRWLPLASLLLASGLGARIALAPSDLRWTEHRAGDIAAARREGRTVVIDFRADWCFNCEVLERTVFADRKVAEELRARNALLVEVDLTETNPARMALFQELGGVALPYFVVLDREGVRGLEGMFSCRELLQALR